MRGGESAIIAGSHDRVYCCEQNYPGTRSLAGIHIDFNRVHCTRTRR